VSADDDGAIRARLQRYVESEFQIGGVLVDRVPTNLTCPQRLEHLRIDGIEISDGDIDFEAERMSMLNP
jgi:hypothetical protein